MKLPDFIARAITNNRTSLGEHPAFPPEEEDTFVAKVINRRFKEVCDNVDYNGTKEKLQRKLGSLISKAMGVESKNIDALEKLVIDVINRIIPLPDNTIKIECKLVKNIAQSNDRLIPEKTDDFSFDSIKDMHSLGDELYKRRMLDALISGAAAYYSSNVKNYAKDLYEVSSALPYLYEEILSINDALLFFEQESLDPRKNTSAAKVGVNITGNADTMVSIVSEGLLFPALLNETLKGILELAISHGLPEERKKAEYVTKKADFKLAEMWDLRLGYPLWQIFEDTFKKCGIDIKKLGLNFFFMTLSMLPCEKFNDMLQEVFGKTRRGAKLVKKMCAKIKKSLDKDEFDQYMDKKKGSKRPLNDDDKDTFTSDELRDGGECFTSDELLNTPSKPNIGNGQEQQLNDSEWF